MAASFSLHLLPQNALTNVLLCMQWVDRLPYSLCSKKCKNAIVDLTLRAPNVRLTFSDDVRIDLMFDNDVTLFTSARLDNNRNLDALQNFNVRFADQDRMLSWNYTGLSYTEWLAHCVDVFHIETIESIIFTRFADDISFEQILKILEAWEIQCIGMQSFERMELAHRILPLHLRCDKILISGNCFGSMANLQKVMFQNLGKVCFHLNPGHVALQVQLEDLLLTNASYLAFLSPAAFSDKDLNRFVKHWMRGSNRRLKKLTLDRHQDSNENDVMKGIRYTNISREDFRLKIRAHNFREVLDRIRGGFNIRSRDGREATIGFVDFQGKLFVQFLVWT